MNFVIPSTRNVPGQHTNRALLASALATLKVPKKKSRWGGNARYAIHRASMGQLYDWLETAKRNHRRLIRKHHPDRGGCQRRAAILNVAWNRVKDLMGRRGISLG